MKRRTEILVNIALILLFAGIVVTVVGLAMLDFDLSKLSAMNLETKSYTVSEPFRHIYIDSGGSDIRIEPSENDKCTILCTEGEGITHTVSVEGDTLIIRRVDEREWYDHIGISWGKQEIVVSLPEAEYGELITKSTSGDVKIPEDFSFDTVKVQNTSGDISVQATVNGELSVQSTSGDISIKNLTAESVTAQSTSGDVKLSDVTAEGKVSAKSTSGDLTLNGIRCAELVAESTSGDINMKDVITQESLAAKAVSGDISLSKCDAATLHLKTTSGDISGSLLSEKVFITDTVSGSVKVPKSFDGGKCEAETTSGDIKLSITP